MYPFLGCCVAKNLICRKCVSIVFKCIFWFLPLYLRKDDLSDIVGLLQNIKINPTFGDIMDGRLST